MTRIYYVSRAAAEQALVEMGYRLKAFTQPYVPQWAYENCSGLLDADLRMNSHGYFIVERA